MVLSSEENTTPPCWRRGGVAVPGVWLRRAFGLLLALTLTWAAYALAEPRLVFARPAEVAMEAAHPGETQRLTFVIRNYSLRTVSVVGGEEGCGPAGCNDICGAPLEILPLCSGELSVDFRSGAPGEHVKEFPLYLDHPAVPVLYVRVRSVVGLRT